MNDEYSTEYASSARSGKEEIDRQANLFCPGAMFDEFMDFLPIMVMVLNSNRQVVRANRAALESAGVENVSDIAGKRPGELLRCVNALTHKSGCGTTKYCRYCGAADAILKSGEGVESEDECRLTVKRGRHETALDLRVKTRPYTVGGESFTFFTAIDISHEKKNEYVEQVFLHTILNTATAIKGFSEILTEDVLDGDVRDEFLRGLWSLSVRIVDEIDAHRQLVAAEQGELMLDVKRFRTKEILDEILETHGRGANPDGKRLSLAVDSVDVGMETDPAVLGRVVGNMVRNAMEAALPGETVTMGCRGENDGVSFWAHNSAVMPENVRLRVFNRFFSTKGRGRGLGAYAMKYLAEKYLLGKVEFTSPDEKGTTFVARFPRELPKKMEL